MMTIHEAVEAELKRQCEASGPYGQLHYLSIGEENLAHVEGAIDLDALAEAVLRQRLGAEYVALVGYDPFEDDPTQTVEQVQALIAGVRAEAERAAEEVRQSQLAIAEGLIRDLCAHEGAEGWSKGLSDRLDEYQFTTKAEV